VNALYHFSVLTKNSKYLPMKTQILENLGLALKMLKALNSIPQDQIKWRQKKAYFVVLLDIIAKYGRVNEIKLVSQFLNSDITKLAMVVRTKGLDEELAENIVSFFQVIRNFGFEPDSKNLQNEIYEYFIGRKESKISQDRARELYRTLNFN
ncbi:MAG: hypothetical protein PUH25_10210, partial [Spirochaetales bacterium]|nr:hypothetical protein [Spirochaetales bacterium]